MTTPVQAYDAEEEQEEAAAAEGDVMVEYCGGEGATEVYEMVSTVEGLMGDRAAGRRGR